MGVPKATKGSGWSRSPLLLLQATNKTITVCMPRAAEALSARGVSFEVIVVDDGSTDDTDARSQLAAVYATERIRVTRMPEYMDSKGRE